MPEYWLFFMMWNPSGSIFTPIRAPTGEWSVVWISHLKPRKSTMMSYCIP